MKVCREGSWVSDTAWPPTSSDRFLYMVPDNGTGTLHLDTNQVKESTADIHFADCVTHGRQCGEFWFISTNSLPGDQRAEDTQCLSWTTAELEKDVSILGLPVLELTVAVNSDAGNVAVRICDVFPDGKATLVTWGLLNLTHSKGHGDTSVTPLVPGERYKVKVTCLSTGYTVPKGHRLRVAVAPTYWPLLWPSRDPVTLAVTTGLDSGPVSGIHHTRLILPIYNLKAPSPDPVFFKPANPNVPVLPVDQIRPSAYRRHVETDVSSQRHCCVIKEDSGKTLLHETGTIFGSDFEARYTMEGEDPLSAKADIDYRKEYEYPEIEGGIQTEIRTYSHMEADQQVFRFAHDLEIKVNGEMFFGKKWEKDIPRHNV